MARIGGIPCPLQCGNDDASVSENKTGTLSVKCHRCEFSGYGTQGTKAARAIREQLTLDDDAAPDAAPARAPAPAPARAGSGTLLG